MRSEQTMCAQQCLDAAEADAMSFPLIVGKLIDAGFEGYVVDFRRSTATYFLPSGESVQLFVPDDGAPVAAAFDARALQAAIREAQTLAPGYTYKGFKRKAKAAGCASYQVSFLGRRAVYSGRTGETHVELFPAADSDGRSAHDARGQAAVRDD